MPRITTPRPPNHARRNAARPQKVHARDFFAQTPVFASRVSPANPAGIRENRLCSKNSHRDVTVDGNGNVRALVKADAANPAASGVVEKYSYDGFGRELAGTTPAAQSVNTFRFSTKQLDAETGMNYYGYRYYAASAGRWINRDPIKEKGGLNVYGMIGNAPVAEIDFLGRESISAKIKLYLQRGFEKDYDRYVGGVVGAVAPWEPDMSMGSATLDGNIWCTKDGYLNGSANLNVAFTGVSIDSGKSLSIAWNAADKMRSDTIQFKVAVSRDPDFVRDFFEGAIGDVPTTVGEVAIGIGFGLAGGSKREMAAGFGVSLVAAGLWNAITSTSESASYIYQKKVECKCGTRDGRTGYHPYSSPGPVLGGNDSDKLYWDLNEQGYL